MNKSGKPHVVIIGAGFTGLSAGFELSKKGVLVTILEKDTELGGLAGSFSVGGSQLEKFYHHWFTNDSHIIDLIEELGTRSKVLVRPTNTGMYYANDFFKLSTPLDLLRFKPLPFLDRLRLGLLAVRAKRVRDWRQLEDKTAEDWLREMGGEKAYNVVWEPLLRGKFGEYAKEISAVWFWNKLKLRGGSRGKGGNEQLAYYNGGFAALAGQLNEHIEQKEGTTLTNAPVEELIVKKEHIIGVKHNNEIIYADAVIATAALPIISDLVKPHVSDEYAQKLHRIRYIGNICLTLELDRSLSETYWLNVNDPGFPFIGVIEHTNFEPPKTYGGKHIVYLSKYLPVSSGLFKMSDRELLEYTIPYLKKMFPEFSRRWVDNFHVWRASFSQPIVERNYSKLIPARKTPINGFYICTMAQIYPEDRGTNYAVREGRSIGKYLAERLLRKGNGPKASGGSS